MHGSAHHLTVLERAEALCQTRGVQLTPLRRDVLRLVLESEAPIGAYALLDQLKASRAKAAPPTVYRALDFLLEQGLIHRLERLNAFMGCNEALEGHGAHHDHAVAASALQEAVLRHLRELLPLTPSELLAGRYAKFRKFGTLTGE